MKGQIIKETPMTIYEVKDELTKIKDSEGELSYRAGKTFEYLEQFAKLDIKKAKALFDALEKLEIPRLRDVHIAKLVDVLPTTDNDVKTVLQGYAVTVSQDNLKKLASTIEEHAA
jgi:DNA-directed RNA polymerase subunit F